MRAEREPRDPAPVRAVPRLEGKTSRNNGAAKSQSVPARIQPICRPDQTAVRQLWPLAADACMQLLSAAMQNARAARPRSRPIALNLLTARAPRSFRDLESGASEGG